MRSPLVFAFVSLLLLPATLFADEPAKGTVILVSSIGGWVILSSGSVILREQRKAREKQAEAAKQKDINS